MFVKNKKRHLQNFVSVWFLEWPSLGSNQGLADYEKQQDAFHLLSKGFKTSDYLAVMVIEVYFWFQLISWKVTTCCTYVVPKTKKTWAQVSKLYVKRKF